MNRAFLHPLMLIRNDYKADLTIPVAISLFTLFREEKKAYLPNFTRVSNPVHPISKV